MKRVMTLCVLVLTLTMALCPAALAADLGSAATAAQVCYPTSISRSEDGTELKKIYDLGPEDDPAGIPRSDFEAGWLPLYPDRSAQTGASRKRKSAAH